MEKHAHSSIHVTHVTNGRHVTHIRKYANVTLVMLGTVLSADYQTAALEHVHKGPLAMMEIVCVGKRVIFTILTTTDVRTTTNVHPAATIVTRTPPAKTYRVDSDVHVTKVIPAMASLATKTTKIPVTNKGAIHMPKTTQLPNQRKIQTLMALVLTYIRSSALESVQ